MSGAPRRSACGCGSPTSTAGRPAGRSCTPSCGTSRSWCRCASTLRCPACTPTGTSSHTDASRSRPAVSRSDCCARSPRWGTAAGSASPCTNEPRHARPTSSPACPSCTTTRSRESDRTSALPRSGCCGRSRRRGTSATPASPCTNEPRRDLRRSSPACPRCTSTCSPASGGTTPPRSSRPAAS